MKIKKKNKVQIVVKGMTLRREKTKKLKEKMKKMMEEKRREKMRAKMMVRKNEDMD